MEDSKILAGEADISFIVRQIEICLKLAALCDDPAVAAALMKLAKAFTDRANRLVEVPDSENNDDLHTLLETN